MTQHFWLLKTPIFPGFAQIVGSKNASDFFKNQGAFLRAICPLAQPFGYAFLAPGQNSLSHVFWYVAIQQPPVLVFLLCPLNGVAASNALFGARIGVSVISSACSSIVPFPPR